MHKKRKKFFNKIKNKKSIDQTKKEGTVYKIFHVRSHANDKKRLDHEKRKTENKRNFGKKQNEIEEGNDNADFMTSIAKDTL